MSSIKDASTSHLQQQDNDEQLAMLKDDINYWSLKCTDQCLDLETLKGEMENDADNLTEEHERLMKELASVEQSRKVLKAQNSQLERQISQQREDVSKQQVQILSQEQDSQKIGSHLDDFIQDSKRKAEAPELTVQEYIRQLADRGDVTKLQQLSQAAYSQISLIVNRQTLMQMQQQMQMMNGGAAPTENGHAPPQFQQFAQPVNGTSPGFDQPPQQFGMNPMFNMGYPGAPQNGAAMGQMQQMPGMPMNPAAFMQAPQQQQQFAGQTPANGPTNAQQQQAPQSQQSSKPKRQHRARNNK